MNDSVTSDVVKYSMDVIVTSGGAFKSAEWAKKLS